MPDARLDVFAAELEQSDDYRVLRRLMPRTMINDPDGSTMLSGIVIDLETTGLDPKRDEIIELAMLPFTFSVLIPSADFRGSKKPAPAKKTPAIEPANASQMELFEAAK